MARKEYSRTGFRHWQHPLQGSNLHVALTRFGPALDAGYLPRSSHARRRRPASACGRTGAARAGLGIDLAIRWPCCCSSASAGFAGRPALGLYLVLTVPDVLVLSDRVRSAVGRADARQARAGAARGRRRRRARGLDGGVHAQSAAHRGHAAVRLRRRPDRESGRSARAAPGRHGRRHAGRAQRTRAIRRPRR